MKESFDRYEYIFELKMDGCRALADVTAEQTRLVSRRGNIYKSFRGLAAEIHWTLKCEAVLDGEIVCLDSEGRSQFYELFPLRGKGLTVFCVFDLLALDGEDLRSRQLIERRRNLLSLIPEQIAPLLHASHIEDQGQDLYQLACERAMEGIAAKQKHGTYGDGWFKIHNPGYSQYEGRRELFEKKQVTRA
jgi:bifunctional non-homologous end joining protein LigD